MYENYSGLGVAFLKAARGIQKEDQKYRIIRRLFASNLWPCLPSISCIHSWIHQPAPFPNPNTKTEREGLTGAN